MRWYSDWSSKLSYAMDGVKPVERCNGLTGTSERTDLTWDTSFSAATPGSVPSC